MARKSAPPSSRCVANECRRGCGWTAPCWLAWRAQTFRRRRTSDVERRRPDFESSSARSSSVLARAGRAALEVARDRTQRRLAGWNDSRLAPFALHPHRFGIEVDRLKVQVHELLRAQPAGVGQFEHRAVAHLQRRGGRDAVQQRRDVLRLERAREPLRLLRGRQQVRGVRSHLAELDHRLVERTDRRELAGDGARARATSGELGGVAAQHGVVDGVGLDAAGAAPERELGRGRRRRRGACARRRRGAGARGRSCAARRARLVAR